MDKLEKIKDRIKSRIEYYANLADKEQNNDRTYSIHLDGYVEGLKESLSIIEGKKD